MGFRKSEKRNRKYETGKDHYAWLPGPRGPKRCQLCGGEFRQKPTQSITVFWGQKFCSKACADKGGFRYSGKEHPNYREEARRRNRGGPHRAWVNAVLNRDGSKCRHCEATGIELHAHHVKSFRDYPELRFDVENGITLCYRCHWKLHSAQNENAVNSVDLRFADNTEPSLQGNLLEGVTTRGRAYRRWQGKCAFCQTFITKPLSDAIGKKNLFCSRVCATTFLARNRTPEHSAAISRAHMGRKLSPETRAKMSKSQKARQAKAKAVNSSTSAAPEREDIV